MRQALLIAYHFPPAAISSGHLRTLSLTRHLPARGWKCSVLSANGRAYSRRDERSLAEIPEGLEVTRAFALDARQHFSIRGSYPILLAQPDRWVTWWIGGVSSGLRLLRKHRPDVIWSTYPIATAHLIAYTLHRLSGIPWIADFRDPVTTDDLGDSAVTAWSRSWVERRALAHASRCVFTTPGARDAYAERYPEATDRLTVVPNGYEERDFASMPAPVLPSANQEKITLVHSGVLYPDGRDPGPFLRALAELRERGALGPLPVRIVLRASGNDDVYRELTDSLGLGDMVRILPAISYADALAEQAVADGLLIFQGSQFNRQIPAKVYEYLRVGRPIFALVDSGGDTAALLRSEQIDTIAQIDDVEGITSALGSFLKRLRNDDITLPTPERVAAYSRVAGAARYAQIFNDVLVSSGA